MERLELVSSRAALRGWISGSATACLTALALVHASACSSDSNPSSSPNSSGSPTGRGSGSVLGSAGSTVATGTAGTGTGAAGRGGSGAVSGGSGGAVAMSSAGHGGAGNMQVPDAGTAPDAAIPIDASTGSNNDAVEMTWMGNSVWVAKYTYKGVGKVLVLDTNMGSQWSKIMTVLGVQAIDYAFCGHGNFDHCANSDAVLTSYGGKLITAPQNCTSYNIPTDKCIPAMAQKTLMLDDAGLKVSMAPNAHSFGTRATGQYPFTYLIEFPVPADNHFILFYQDSMATNGLTPADGVDYQAELDWEMTNYPNGVTLFISMVAPDDATLAMYTGHIKPKFYIPQHTPLTDFNPNLMNMCSGCGTTLKSSTAQVLANADYVTTYLCTGTSVMPVDKGYRTRVRM